MLIRVEYGMVETRPIAGTRRRGETKEADIQLEKELLSDVKERAEHLMLVDLGRNDIGRISEFGSVSVDQYMTVEKYSHVMHLVSSVQGRLRKGLTAIDALFGCFPAGTLTGAPKIRAMEIIAELEPVKRGIYGGTVAYIDFTGNLDSCIAIRTIVQKGNTIRFQAGAGIVFDSTPEREFEETLEKLRANFSALELLSTSNTTEQPQDFSKRVILVIDNYDSFTHNLVQYLGEMGCLLEIIRNDRVSVSDIRRMHPQKIVISPGPCTPSDAGIILDVVRELHKECPIVGVCLGHQAIGQALGGRIVKAPEIVHGKTSAIHHRADGLFQNVPLPFEATRYHSLIVDRSTLPGCLEVTAWTSSGIIMGLRHRGFPTFGVQFHPESIATENGKKILANFLATSL